MAWQPKKTPEIPGPPEQKESNTTGPKIQSSPQQAAKSSQKPNLYGPLLESIKRRAMALHPELWGAGAEVPAPSMPEKKASGFRKGKKRSDFPDRYPKIFKSRSAWLVFDYVWRFAKKTKTRKLRWEGYLTIVARDTGVPYITVKRTFKRLEAAGIFIRWNTGKKFPGNIASGSGPAYHHTVVTVAWSPVWLAWQKKKARQEKTEKKS